MKLYIQPRRVSLKKRLLYLIKESQFSFGISDTGCAKSFRSICLERKIHRKRCKESVCTNVEDALC